MRDATTRLREQAWMLSALTSAEILPLEALDRVDDRVVARRRASWRAARRGRHRREDEPR